MRQGYLARAVFAFSLCFLAQGAVLGQVVTRVVPVAPAAPAAVPLVPRSSFLQNMGVSGATPWNSLQQPIAAPSLPNLGLPPSAAPAVEAEPAVPSASFEVPAPVWAGPVQPGETPAGASAAEISGRPFQVDAPAKTAGLPVSAKGIQQAGSGELRHSYFSRQLESSLAEGAVLFDGGRFRAQSAGRDAVEAEPPIQPASRKVADLAQTAGLQGQALLHSVHEISGRGFRMRGYDEARDYMYSVADHVEQNGQTGILDAYSGAFLQGRGGDGGRYKETGDMNDDGYTDHGVNAEHVWPQSFFDRALPMRSDLHHLMATLEHPNSIRSNFPFGEISKDHPEYSNKGGARMAHGVFEPPDFTKGRVARAAFYFFSRYSERNIFMAAGRHFWTREMIATLLRWNREFPPSRFEMDRNDLVERWQGNRNPFIDDPGLADRIGLDAFLGGGTGGRTSSAETQGRDAVEAGGRPIPINHREGQSRKAGRASLPPSGKESAGRDGKRWENSRKDSRGNRRDRSFAYR